MYSTVHDYFSCSNVCFQFTPFCCCCCLHMQMFGNFLSIPMPNNNNLANSAKWRSDFDFSPSIQVCLHNVLRINGHTLLFSFPFTVRYMQILISIRNYFPLSERRWKWKRTRQWTRTVKKTTVCVWVSVREWKKKLRISQQKLEPHPHSKWNGF